MEQGELKGNLTRGEIWLRGLHMLLFAIAYTVAEIVLTVIIIFQFFSSLITARVNDRLLKLGQQLGTYIYQLLLFFTFNTEERPYPFTAWPRGVPPQAKPAGKRAPAKKAMPEGDSSGA
ncbi:MAG: DUF4389 domain-containing protein [Gammaproteobacteria bacterium]|nr:DUF4389 domain-containing protein [Gammaproteobacteria bacterium]